MWMEIRHDFINRALIKTKIEIIQNKLSLETSKF